MFLKQFSVKGARAFWQHHAGIKTTACGLERTTHSTTSGSSAPAASLSSLTSTGPELPSGSLQTPPLPFAQTSPIQGKPELIPGIPLTEFEERRYRLLDLIRSASDVRSKDSINYIVVLASSAMKFSSDRTPYSFRQNTDFLYMTGCQEPDCALVILMLSGRMRSIMFLQPKDQPIPQWGGVQAGIEGAPMAYGVDEAYPYSHITSYLSGLLKSERRFSMWFDERECEHPGTAKILDEARRQHSTALFRSPAAHVQKMRLVKSPAEIAIIRRACDITGKAFNNTIAASRPGMNERAIHARIDAECLKLGAKRLAYPPVVAGGARANRIHYTDNNRQIAKGDLVLMDAGCEYNSFTSDITRTWPISGNFTSPQKILYAAVLRVQASLLENMLGSGPPTLDTLFNRMCALFGVELRRIGFMRNATAPEIARMIPGLCPHHVAHYIGMDVQDTPLVPRNIPLQPGMVISIEPGLYIPSSRTDVSEMYRGLAIRIEDDILVTENGPQLLTGTCVKTVEGLENLIGSGS